MQTPHDARDEALRSRAATRATGPIDAARGRRDDRAELRRDRRLRRARVAPLLKPLGIRLPLLAGVRLLGHRAAAPRRRAPPSRAARGADGRALQGRDQPPRQPRPRRRQRRDRRRRRAPERAGAGDARQGPRRLVPRRDAAQRQAQRWKGARPMLPDGPPVLGASGAEGVWLNVGHGGSGWALACRLGAARRRRDRRAARRRSRSTASASSACGLTGAGMTPRARAHRSIRIDAPPRQPLLGVAGDAAHRGRGAARRCRRSR